MGTEVRIDYQILSKTKINGFALERVLKESNVGYEYFIQNQWFLGKPKLRPDGKRIVFNNIDQFRAARDVYFTWVEIENTSTYNPKLPGETMSKLYKARMDQTPLTLFTPWGFRPAGDIDKETIVLDRLANFSRMLAERRIKAQIIIMPADLYATEINGLDQKEVDQYFLLIAKEAQSREFLCVPWSAIREENKDQYQRLKEGFTNNEIQRILPNPVIGSALSAAEKRVKSKTMESIQQSAFAYLRERMCEAVIIKDQLDPIKISAASIHKDNCVDINLPRLYIVPVEEQFPWLK